MCKNLEMVKKIIKYLVRKVPRPILIKLSLIVNKPIALLYRGNNVECTVCEKTFRKFLPYGNKASENRLCPNCLTLERHRLLWLYLKNRTDFFKSNSKVLHIAPEQPFLKRFKKLKGKNYITADLYSPIADVKTDIRDLVFEDNSFDIIICNHVLEHIDNEQKALKELYRVLKASGWAILQVPIDYTLEATYEDSGITSPKEREKHFGQYDHLRSYGKDYAERLRKARFAVKEDKYIESFTKEEVEIYRLDKNEIIYYCTK